MSFRIQTRTGVVIECDTMQEVDQLIAYYKLTGTTKDNEN